MSNNPGKRGRPAPWVKKAQEHKERALQEYRRAHHPTYNEWCERRSTAARAFRKEEEAKRPEFHQIHESMKASDKRLRHWDKANPSPLTWEEHERLEAEFEAQYVRPDYS